MPLIILRDKVSPTRVELLGEFRTLPEHGMGFPGGSVVKNQPTSAGDAGSNLGSGRSPGGGNGKLLQYSCLEEILWTKAPDGLQSMGSQRVRHDSITKPEAQGLFNQAVESCSGIVYNH